MEEVFKKSGILEWNEDNINNASEESGVLVLTNSPTNGTAIKLECVDNIRARLASLEREYVNEFQPGFFYWYETPRMEDAEALKERLQAKYSIS